MKNKAIKTIIIFSIIASILGVIGFTYSYFSLEVEGNSKDIVLATGDLRLKYTDVSTLSLENALPGDSITKTLTVENIGTKDTSYNIVWKDLINQINYYDLHLDMKCKGYKNYGKDTQEEYGECKSFYKAVPYTETKINKDIKRDIEIEVGVTQVYELTITFLNRNYSQDENLNKSFSGRIELEEYIDESVYCYSDDNKNYVNGQYTYTFNDSNGWGVHLTDRESTEPVNSILCTYINDRPVTSFSYAFNDSKTVGIDLGNINTKNVTDMDYMFYGSSATTISGLELFDTSNVKSMTAMFRDTKTESLDLSSFDTSSVTNMALLFSGSKASYIDVSSFNISNTINISSLFNNSNVEYIDLSSFNTSKVTNMRDMFRVTKLMNLDLSSFDTSKVTNMNGMFLGSSLKFLDLSSFNTSNVTSMTGMFQSSLITEIIGLNSFDTSNVTSMGKMFYYSRVTELDLSSFNTSKVTNMEGMFRGSKVRILDLSSFNIDNVTDMSYMFSNVSAIIGYAKNEETALKFNDSSVTAIPSTLKFVVR